MDLKDAEVACVTGHLDTIDALAAHLDPSDPAGSLRTLATVREVVATIIKATKGSRLVSLVVSMRLVLLRDLDAREAQFHAAMAPPEADPSRLWMGQAASARQRFEPRITGDVLPVSCFISYAWPTPRRAEKEKWVQPFLEILRNQLRDVGVRTMIDTQDCTPGANMVTFMNNCKSATFVILACTESLLEKHISIRSSNVQTELAILADRLDYDLQTHEKTGIYPVLLSGSAENSIPPPFRRIGAIGAHAHEYLAFFEKLVAAFAGRVMNTRAPQRSFCAILSQVYGRAIIERT